MTDSHTPQPRLIMCNWCGKPHVQPAQNALEALRGCCKVPDVTEPRHTESAA